MDMAARQEFLEWLRDEIRVRGWTDGDFAKRSGISSAQVSRVFEGTRNPGAAFIEKTARALRVPVEDVWRRAEGHVRQGAVLTVPEVHEWGERIALLTEADRAAVIRIVDQMLDALERQPRNQPRDDQPVQ